MAIAQTVAFSIVTPLVAAHVLAANGNNIHLAGDQSDLGNRADLVDFVE